MDRDGRGKPLCCTYVLFLPLYSTYVLLFPLYVHQRLWDVIGFGCRLGFAVKLHQRGNSHQRVPSQRQSDVTLGCHKNARMFHAGCRSTSPKNHKGAAYEYIMQR